MRLHEILFEAGRYELDVNFRGDKVQLSYGDKAAVIYQTEEAGDGIVFSPISPWGGEQIFTGSHDPRKAWQEAKQKIFKKVHSAFSAVTPRARRAGKRIGMIR